ncbi:hypothetical protein Hanom_Chr10g00888751 [Helianthus anomalus]
MLDVKDRGHMEKQLSTIRMGDYKTKFNVARFVLEDGEINERKPVHNDMKPNRGFQKSKEGLKQMHDLRNVGTVNNMSYKEAFVGASEGKSIKIDDNICAFEELHGRAILVKVGSLDVFRKIRFFLQ